MEEKILELKRELDLILSNYAVDQVAKESGGSRRASKGILTRKIYEKIIKFAINESKVNFKFFYKTSSLPFKIKKELPYLKLPQDFGFKRKFDKSGKGNEVEYDGFLTFQNEIKMFLEFKSYTEVSMLKRVFVDAFIAKQFFPNAKYSLCMLESAMGSPRSLISHSSNCSSVLAPINAEVTSLCLKTHDNAIWLIVWFLLFAIFFKLTILTL